MATDFRDLLRAFADHDVRFLIVGAYALAVLGRPRATGDLDVWVEATPDNARRAYEALRVFGAPLHNLTAEDLATPGIVFQIGLPPLRIDVWTEITAWNSAPQHPRVRRSRQHLGDVQHIATCLAEASNNRSLNALVSQKPHPRAATRGINSSVAIASRA